MDMNENDMNREAYAGLATMEQSRIEKLTAGEMSGDEEKEKERQDEQERKKQEYNEYVKQMTPTKSLPLQMLKAFICGGIICIIGQGILNYAATLGMDQDTAGAWCSLLLVLLSVLLTGFSVYQIIADWGGAGALVPITGFANSVASPAIEYKTEGQVYGIGVKIFTIAGPVILYGVFTSWCLGLVYWIGKAMGWI